MRFSGVVSTLVSVGLVAGIVGCDPIPRRTMTSEEKTADMYWIYSQFNEYYAPLEYKQTRHGFDYATIKQKYLVDAVATKTNEEFYDLMYRFVSEFKDAHTSAALMNSDLPGRAKISYLGFSAKRSGKCAVVTTLLPTINPSATKFPVKVGDKISKIDGVELGAYIEKELVKFEDLGQKESNLTVHTNRVFNRLSTVNGQPTKDVAVLTIGEGEAAREVTLPWIVKDLVDFRKAQAEAKRDSEENKNREEDEESLSFDGGQGHTLRLGFIGFNGENVAPGALARQFRRDTKGFRVWDTYRFLGNVAEWTALPAAAPSGKLPMGSIGETLGATPIEALKKVRVVPEKAITIAVAKTYPAYVTKEKTKDAEGKVTGSKLVGYILLDTFSPAASSKVAEEEFKATLSAMQDLGVKDLVIDMLNNGGGSLILGARLAQALSSQMIEQPRMQFALSETWLDEFEGAAREANSDAEAELARRVFVSLSAEKAAGKRLSSAYPIDSLLPYGFEANKGLEGKFNVLMLVNEMCASMCDIFAATLQDNGMAKAVGQRTMGAGGNVVNHFQAPNSHLELRQTESLIVRKDGSYIENNGVTPEYEMVVSESAEGKYEAVRQKAIEIFTVEPKKP